MVNFRTRILGDNWRQLNRIFRSISFHQAYWVIVALGFFPSTSWGFPAQIPFNPFAPAPEVIDPPQPPEFDENVTIDSHCAIPSGLPWQTCIAPPPNDGGSSPPQIDDSSDDDDNDDTGENTIGDNPKDYPDDDTIIGASRDGICSILNITQNYIEDGSIDGYVGPVVRTRVCRVEFPCDVGIGSYSPVELEAMYGCTPEAEYFSDPLWPQPEPAEYTGPVAA